MVVDAAFGIGSDSIAQLASRAPGVRVQYDGRPWPAQQGSRRRDAAKRSLGRGADAPRATVG